MGYKSRPGGWEVGICISDCTNRDKCSECFNKSQYKSPGKEDKDGKHQDTEHR